MRDPIVGVVVSLGRFSVDTFQLNFASRLDISGTTLWNKVKAIAGDRQTKVEI